MTAGASVGAPAAKPQLQISKEMRPQTMDISPGNQEAPFQYQEMERGELDTHSMTSWG